MNKFTKENTISTINRFISIILIFSLVILTFNLASYISSAENNTEKSPSTPSSSGKFSDIPDGHWSYQYVHKLKDLGITNGIGNYKFGLGMTITRGEFITFLVRLMEWELVNPETGSFNDNLDKSRWYYQYIETALYNNVILKDTEFFRPEDKITREEIAIMIVRALGLDNLARQVSDLPNSFIDVERNPGYLTIARDVGIIRGVVQSSGEVKFLPYNSAVREEAAAMMVRMHEKLNNPLNELHAFYAIKSYPQRDYIKDLSSVSFGWSRLEYDKETGQVILNTSSKNYNDFSIPAGYLQPLGIAEENGIPAQLMVFLKNDIITTDSTNDINSANNSNDNTGDEDDNKNISTQGNSKRLISTASYILTNKDIRKNVISSILKALQGSSGSKPDNSADSSATSSSTDYLSDKSNSDATDTLTDMKFDGVVIDFENMSGESLCNGFNEFLLELKTELKTHGKSLWVAVHPKRAPDQIYYDAYDYKTIGEIADRVILMAHDYNAKQLTEAEMEAGYNITPLTPIAEVYFALKAITDEKDGVSDPGKVLLQISFDSAQWKLKDGKVINNYALRPDYEAVIKRLLKEDTEILYSSIDENPYAKFTDPSDGTDNIIWYEDTRSVEWKIKLARLFEVGGISIWRLGNIPNYVSDTGPEASNSSSSALNPEAEISREIFREIFMEVWYTIKKLVSHT